VAGLARRGSGRGREVRGRALRIGLSIVASAVFLGFAVRHVDWHEAVRALSAANYLYVFPILIVTVWTLYIRAQRWRVLLTPVGTVPMRPLVAATNIGFMANMVLPLRVGEVIRPVLVSREAKLPISSLLATILLERIADMCTVLLLFGLSASVVSVSPEVRQWGYMLTGFVGVSACVIGLFLWREEFAVSVVRRICDRLPGGGSIYRFMLGFVKALEILGSPTAFLRVFAWSLYLWLTIALLNSLVLAAFSLPLRSAILLTSVVAVAVSVPSAPGYIGAFQLGCVLALKIFGIAESEALAFSIVLHLTQFVAIIGAGLYSLWRENMSLQEVEAAAG